METQASRDNFTLKSSTVRGQETQHQKNPFEGPLRTPQKEAWITMNHHTAMSITYLEMFGPAMILKKGSRSSA